MTMHTVHLPQKGQSTNGFIAAALGILFDTKNYDKKAVTKEQIKVIDKFFDSLQLDKSTDPTPTQVSYGDLISALDTDNRWVYKGSVTTPPCGKLVYWNVIKTVYPIKEKHLKQYRDVQLPRQKSQDIKKTGNFRVINPVNEHDVRLITTDVMGKYEIATIVLAVFTGLFFIAMIVLAVLVFKAKKEKDTTLMSVAPSRDITEELELKPVK